MMSKAKVNSYIHALDHLHPFIAARAAAALGELDDRSAVGPLIGALGHSVGEVRRAAALSLGRLGDKGAIGPLRALVSRDESEDIFWAAIEALARLGDEQARGLLIDAIIDGDANAHQRAVAVVAKIGDGRLLDPLRSIIEDQDGRVIKAIADALGAIEQMQHS